MADTRHGTLTANVVETVDLGSDFGNITVLNRDGAGVIWFTVDGVDPVAEADGTYILPAAISSYDVRTPDPGNTVVKMLSDTTTKYSVIAG